MHDAGQGTMPTKCGEVFFEENGCFLFACTACFEVFHEFNDFEDHVGDCCLPTIPGTETSDMTFRDQISVEKSASSFHESQYEGPRTDGDEKSKNFNFYETKSKDVTNNLRDSEEFDFRSCSETYMSSSNSLTDSISMEISEHSGCESTFKFNRTKLAKIGTDDDCNASSKAAKVKHKGPTNKENRFKCPLCHKSYSSNKALSTHLYTHSDVRPFECTMCPQAFKNKTNLVAHIRCHLGDKRYSCDYCEKKFVRNNQRLIHMRTHTGEKPYQCDECDLCFRTSNRLSDHKKRHTETPNFECEICLRKFYSKDSLKNHQVSHSTEKPFGCEVCLKTFARKRTLVSHMKIHSDVKEYVCNECGKAFAQSPGLICHMKIHKR